MDGPGAARMGGFLGPISSNHRSLFPQIFLKHGWVWLKIRQKLLKMGSFPSKLIIKMGPKASFSNKKRIPF